jgi:UDP-glucose 4-epimerase
VCGSVLDRALVRRVLDESQPEEVYHLAAAVGVGLLAESPLRTIETNVRGTEVLLEALAAARGPAGRARLFLASSSEVYGNNSRASWHEEDALVLGSAERPRWSYGVSKALAEFLSLACARERGLDVLIGRLFNVVGPRQVGAYGMVLPRLVEAALRGGPLVVYDDGQQVRCFAHVADVVSAVMKLMDAFRPGRGEPDAGGAAADKTGASDTGTAAADGTGASASAGRLFNIGSDAPVTILELARRVAAEVDPTLEIRFRPYTDVYGPAFDECRRRVPDLTRLRAAIGQPPCRSLEETVRDVVRWKRTA